MSISHFITHHLYKEADSEAVVSLRADELTITEYLERFVNDLKHAYQRRAGREYGVFDTSDEVDKTMRLALDEFCKKQDGFLDLTTTIMQELKKLLDKTETQFVGHVIFLYETHMENDVFHMFLVSYRESVAIDQQLDVQTIQTIDLGTSLLAVKLNVSIWQKDAGDGYYSLAAPRTGNDWIDGFRKLVGFVNNIDKEKQTTVLLNSVSSYSESLPSEQAQVFKNQVVDYCLEQDKLDEGIEFEGLSEAVEDIEGVDRKKFAEQLKQDLPSQAAEVRVDRASLKRFVRFTGREKDLSISFSASELGNRIAYQADTDTLSITGLPKALRQQLMQHIELK